MTLRELKSSLSRFPPDMDDTELIVQFVGKDGKEDMDLLVYVGYAQLSEMKAAIFLGTWKAFDDRVKEGKTLPPEDYRIHPDNTKQ